MTAEISGFSPSIPVSFSMIEAMLWTMAEPLLAMYPLACAGLYVHDTALVGTERAGLTAGERTAALDAQVIAEGPNGERAIPAGRKAFGVDVALTQAGKRAVGISRCHRQPAVRGGALRQAGRRQGRAASHIRHVDDTRSTRPGEPHGLAL